LLGFSKVPVFLCHPVYYMQHNGVLNVKENDTSFTSCLHKLTAPSSHSVLSLGWKQHIYTTCRCPPASLKSNTNP